eukprot:m.43557 g.43557  ORF g.43557 m.43557 type:complete len:113 (-) comp10793_c0_seq2:328-666(-)
MRVECTHGRVPELVSWFLICEYNNPAIPHPNLTSPHSSTHKTSFTPKSREVYISSKLPLALSTIADNEILTFEMNTPAAVLVPRVVLGRAFAAGTWRTTLLFAGPDGSTSVL